jgi:ABC-type Na+ transport system ATPase subunit NatA
MGERALMKKKDIYNKAKATCGIDAQVTKAVEELAELQKELCKFLLDDGNMEHIAEEIADVKIMVEQIELILECKWQVKEHKRAKIQRLSDRLDREQPKCLTMDCGECKYNLYQMVCDRCEQYSQFKKSDAD